MQEEKENKIWVRPGMEWGGQSLFISSIYVAAFDFFFFFFLTLVNNFNTFNITIYYFNCI